MARILETLIEGRVKQQPAMAFDHRQHGLARARHIAAEQQANAIVQEQTLGQRAGLLGVGRRVIKHRLDHPTQHATGGIDLVNRKKRGVDLGLLDRGGNTGLGEQHADQPVVTLVPATIHFRFRFR